MGVGGVLMVALGVSLLAGCGDQGPGTTPSHSGVVGQVNLGPQCPVEQVGHPCADKPAAGSRITVAEQLAGRVVARTTTDADGRYRVAVPPGKYVVTGNAGMSCELVDVRVRADTYAQVNIRCDTGIR